MGVCKALDIFQDKMSALMDNLEFVRVYLGDLIVITSGSFEEHLAKVRRLRSNSNSMGSNAILISESSQYPKFNTQNKLLRKRVSNQTQKNQSSYQS